MPAAASQSWNTVSRAREESQLEHLAPALGVDCIPSAREESHAGIETEPSGEGHRLGTIHLEALAVSITCCLHNLLKVLLAVTCALWKT